MLLFDGIRVLGSTDEKRLSVNTVLYVFIQLADVNSLVSPNVDFTPLDFGHQIGALGSRSSAAIRNGCITSSRVSRYISRRAEIRL